MVKCLTNGPSAEMPGPRFGPFLAHFQHNIKTNWNEGCDDPFAMQIHTSAKVEHDVRLMSVVEAASQVIVDEIGRPEKLGIAWETTEQGLLSVSVVDRQEVLPSIRIDGVAGDDLAGLRERIRRQCRNGKPGAA